MSAEVSADGLGLRDGGPFSPDRTELAGEVLGHTVRYLNHATRTQLAFAEPADVASLIGHLVTLTGREGQLLAQTGDALRRQAERRGAIDTAGVDPRATALEVEHELAAAARALGVALRHLEGAHTGASRIVRQV